MVSQEARIRILTYIAAILIFIVNGLSPRLVLSASTFLETEYLDVERIEAPMMFVPSSQITKTPKIIQATARTSSARQSLVLMDLYFDTHRNRISEDAAASIDEGVRLLSRDENATVKIEVHCDERGTSSYSMALGNKRAQGIREYLEDLGVSDSRITALSYGHEKPLCAERTQACWEDNLRIQNAFRLLAITQPRNGCMVRLKLHGESAIMRPAAQLAHRQPFLQKIRIGHPRRLSSVQAY